MTPSKELEDSKLQNVSIQGQKEIMQKCNLLKILIAYLVNLSIFK